MPKKTFELAEKAGATLVTQVKNNQKHLFKQIVHGCKIQHPTHVFKDSFEKAHGRIEKRHYEVFNSSPMLDKWKEEWPYVRSIIKVTAMREDLSSSKGMTCTERYYITNNKEIENREIVASIRRHWWIENKNHHVKDVAFREDVCRKTINPFIFSYCIDTALNILNCSGEKNINGRLIANSFDFKNMLSNCKKYLF